jgi:hypothetical protein
MLEAFPQIAIFLFALIFSHVALSRWKLHRHAQIWMFVEYVWLTTAALGVAAIANEVRRMDAAADVVTKEQTVRGAYQQARNMACGGDMFMDGNQAANLAKGDREASWYRYLVDSLELGYENDRWWDFLSQNAELEFGPPRAGQSSVPQGPPKGWLRLDLTKDDPDVLEHARLTLHDLRQLYDAREAWHAARSTQTTLTALPAYRNFRGAVSWVIVFALALRLTKVRADRLRTEGRERSVANGGS